MPISPKVQRELDKRPSLCQRRLVFRDHECQGRITQEHALTYGGKRLDEAFAIIKICAWAHEVDEFQDGGGMDKAKNEYIALSQMTDADRARFPKGRWLMRETYLRVRFFGRK